MVTKTTAKKCDKSKKKNVVREFLFSVVWSRARSLGRSVVRRGAYPGFRRAG
jgi:hypothetical protein